MKQFCFAIALAGGLGGCAGTESPNGGGSGTGGSAGAAGSATQGGAGNGTGGMSVGGAAGSATPAGTAGMGGELGGGAAGMSGAAGSGGTGGGSANPSAGCSKLPNQALAQWVRYTLMAQGLEREYFVSLPSSYDPIKPYRLMFMFPGCTDRGDDAAKLWEAPNAEAIVVGPSPAEVGGCFTYSLDSEDVAFFDEMLNVLEANFCVDKNRVFTSGHSSGSYFSNILGCQRSNILRAQGNIAGKLPGIDLSKCLKQSIAGMLIHDEDDGTNDISGGILARDRLIKLNGCTTETMPVEPAPCVEYQGCMPGYPVIWCQTKGKGHNRQDEFSVPALYNFFAQF
ncbi:MAG TPA: hypothetical protein VJN18_05140 [Polyangiaceae bacterium]|nr:hypothetical protein [Polyangiaceae bacterium]